MICEGPTPSIVYPGHARVFDAYKYSHAAGIQVGPKAVRVHFDLVLDEEYDETDSTYTNE